MLQVKQIVNSIFTSNTYIVFDSEYDYCWLIDVGDYPKVIEELSKKVTIKGVFLTHAHFDHTCGINDLHKNHPECRVYTSEYGKEALYDEKKNFSKYHNAPFVFEGNDVVVLNDGDKIELYPGVYIIAHETPGHCPSCLTYVLDNWIFTGDAYIPDVKVVTKLPGGDRIMAKQSTEIIIKLAEDKIVCSGHGKIKRNN